MAAHWLALVQMVPEGVVAQAEVTGSDGARAGFLVVWEATDAPMAEAAKVDPALADPHGNAADVSLVLVPFDLRIPFDDPAVSEAMRRTLARPPPSAFSTLVRGDARFAGSITARRGDGLSVAIADDPFAVVFPARRLRVGPGLVGTTPEPAGPGIQRNGSANPWPAGAAR